MYVSSHCLQSDIPLNRIAALCFNVFEAQLSFWRGLTDVICPLFFPQDAGSSGTRMYMYQWFEGEIPTVFGAPIFQPFNATEWTLRVSPGISTFANHLADLDPYFEPFLDYAIARIPKSYYNRTYVFLYATAGMRLLTPDQQHDVLASTRRIFSSWPFRFLDPSWSRVISGVDEGVYGWMTANYLLDNFKSRDPLKTVGALDLGGASTQITFVPEIPIPPEQGGTRMIIGGVVYNLYSYSYLGLGIDQARNAKNKILLQKFCPGNACNQINDGCLPLGYEVSVISSDGTPIPSYGTSDGQFCQTYTKAVLPPSSCSNCSIADVQQPPLRGKFYAMSGFSFGLQMWGLPEANTSIENIESATQTWCSQNFDKLWGTHQSTPTSLLTSYCFTGYWESTLLKAWGFNPTDPEAIVYAEKIGSVALSWTLGAMVVAAQEVDALLGAL